MDCGGESSNFVLVDAVSGGSSWVLVPDAQSQVDACMSDATRVRWNTVIDAQEQACALERRRELQRLLNAQRREDSASQRQTNDDDEDLALLSDAHAEALATALRAEAVSASNRERLMSQDTAVAEAAQRREGIVQIPMALRTCECLGASAGCHRSDCIASRKQ